MQRYDGGFAVRRRRARWALFVLFLAGGAAAQDAGEPGAAPHEALPRYTVELIVFTYGEGVASGSEIFVPEPLPDPYATPDEERPAVFGDLPSGPLSEPADDAPAPATPASGAGMPADAPEKPEISGFDDDLADIPLRARIELHTLPRGQYGMNDIYDKLVELDAYHPIMHAAWTQTTPPRDASPAIRLRALGEPPPGLDGTVKLYQGRFVHLGVDIALDAPAAGGAGGGGYDPRQSATDRAIAGSGIGDARSTGERPPEDAVPVWSDRPFAASDGFPARPVRYRISEVRIMKDGEIRYYDHPRFGVIARLTEVEEEDPETADDEAAFVGGDP